jgi:nucleoside-diphosphate-sugar epimerase
MGRAMAHELVQHGHEVVSMHRGLHEAELPGGVTRVHLDRRDVAAIRRACAEHGVDALVHVCAYDRQDAEAIVAALPRDCLLVVLSSQDVYRAFHTAQQGGEAVDAVPLDESAPLRGPAQRYLRRGHEKVGDVDPESYEKLDVEEVCLARGAVVLRLPMVYGEHDPREREGFVLRRVRAGRRRIPIGEGSWLWSRLWVGDVATAVRCVIARGPAREVFNLAERRTWPVAEWARRIARAAGAEVTWVRVPEDMLSDDLGITAARQQHLLLDASRARQMLGWEPVDPAWALERSVWWHMARMAAAEASPGASPGASFDDDDRALAAALSAPVTGAAGG